MSKVARHIIQEGRFNAQILNDATNSLQQQLPKCQDVQERLFIKMQEHIEVMKGGPRVVNMLDGVPKDMAL